jgi:hypothetical protein
MAVAWFLAPYRQKALNSLPARYCAVDEFTAQIRADGGTWAETECLGNYTVVKVRASSSTLQAIGAAAGVRRLPKDRLDDPLSSLTNTQKTTLRNWIEGLGYTRAEWQADLGTNLGAITLRQALRFILKRHLALRYDASSNTLVCDGEERQCLPLLEDVDTAVTEV